MLGVLQTLLTNNVHLCGALGQYRAIPKRYLSGRGEKLPRLLDHPPSSYQRYSDWYWLPDPDLGLGSDSLYLRKVCVSHNLVENCEDNAAVDVAAPSLIKVTDNKLAPGLIAVFLDP